MAIKLRCGLGYLEEAHGKDGVVWDGPTRLLGAKRVFKGELEV